MPRFSLKVRDRQPEIMDQPGLDRERHRHALKSLARINRCSGSARILWPAIAELKTTKPVRVLDIATGGGDVPIQLWRWSQRQRLALEFSGCDLSETAVDHARSTARLAGADVSFFVHDVLRDGVPQGFDAIICSLFLHHLAEDEAIELLRSMGQHARKLILVNDLARSRLGYFLAFAGSRILSRSDVVRTDGPLSVRAAFTPGEALELAQKAGLSGARVVPRWPCRYLLSWRRDDAGRLP